MNSQNSVRTGQSGSGQKGRLIVIEGIDGSGKTVQTNMLIKRLSEEGSRVQMTDFPQYGRSFFANMIEKYLRGEYGWPQKLRDHLEKHPLQKDANTEAKVSGPTPDEVNPYLTSLLYAGDRWEMKEEMNKWISAGDIIISNRYVCSNMAHQGAKINDDVERDEFFKWLEELEYNKYAVPKPDLVIYLHIPLEVSQELIKLKVQNEKGFKSKIDMHEKDVGYLKRSQDIYIAMARENSSWSMIDCYENNQILPKEKIAEKVWDAVIKVVKN